MGRKSLLSPLKLLCLIGLLAIFSSTIAKNPALPLLVTHIGGNQMTVGFVAGISAFVGILFSLPAGYLSDKFGRQRLLLAAGIVFATAPFLYLIATNAWQLAWVRFYHGLATAIFGPVAMAMVADLYQKSRGEKMGWFSTATLLGRFSAPAFGGMVLAISATDDTLGFTALYLFCGISGVGAMVAMLLLDGGQKISTAEKPLEREPIKIAQLFDLFANRAILLVCGVEASILFAYGIYETFLPLRGIGLGLTTWQIGLCLSSQILTIAISKPVLGRFSDRHGRALQIAGGAASSACCMVLLAYATSFTGLLISSVLLGLSVSIVTSASAAYIADQSSRESHGSAMGMLGSIMDIGHTLGPVAGGVLAFSYNIQASFLGGGAVLILFALFFFGFLRKTNRIS